MDKRDINTNADRRTGVQQKNRGAAAAPTSAAVGCEEIASMTKSVNTVSSYLCHARAGSSQVCGYCRCLFGRRSYSLAVAAVDVLIIWACPLTRTDAWVGGAFTTA